MILKMDFIEQLQREFSGGKSKASIKLQSVIFIRE